MATKELVYSIGADYKDLLRNTDEAIAKNRVWRRELREMEQQQREHRQAVADLGQGMTTFGAAVVAGLGLAAKAAIDWESAFTGARKTVDGSDAEIAALEKELRQLAKTLPASHQEIAAVAEAAGQLGIKRDDIAKFTRTMIDLGNTTNLTAEEAATELAKLSNIMGTSAKDVDKLGSALVALGNDGASTEKDILDMALRIAGAGKTIGLTEAQVLGFASALSSVGIEAEAGGSSISRVMISVEQAVRGGGDELAAFARVAGMSAQDFRQAYERDAAGAIGQFITGLGNMQKAGGDVFKTLADLGFSEILVRDALLRMSNASGVLTNSLKVGSSAWAENLALTEEAEKRYATSASQLQVAANQVKDAAIDVGAAVAPAFADAAGSVADLVSWFQQLPEPLKDVVTFTGAAAGGLALLSGGLLIAAPRVLEFREGMRSLATEGGRATSALGRFGLFMSGPWGAAIAGGVTLLGLFGVVASKMSARQREMAEVGRSLAQVIAEQNGMINDTVRAAAAKDAAEKDMLKNAKSLGIELGMVTDAVLDQGTAYSDLIKYLDDYISVTADSGGYAADAIELKNSLISLVEGKRLEIEATKDASAASKTATAAQKEQAEAYGFTTEQIADATDKLDELIRAVDEASGAVLSSREAQRRYLEEIAKSAELLATNGKTLDVYTEKGRDNAAQLDAQAKAAISYATALAQEASATGDSVAGAMALKASLEASRPGLIAQAQAFGMSETEAIAYADAVLRIPDAAITEVLTPGALASQAELQRVYDKIAAIPPGKMVNVGVLSADAVKKLEDLGYRVQTLPDGSVAVTADTAQAQKNLTAFLSQPANKVVQIVYQGTLPGGYQAAPGKTGLAHGAVMSYFAGGGFNPMPANVARMVPANTWRVVGDRAWGDEAFIPILPGNARSESILDETNRRMGRGPGWDVPLPSRSVHSVVTRNVDAGLHIHGNVVLANHEELLTMERQRRSETLFRHGLAGI